MADAGTYLVVYFWDGGSVHVADSPANESARQWVKECKSPAEYWVSFECIEGEELEYRVEIVAGFYRSTPEGRRAEREHMARLRAEDPQPEEGEGWRDSS